MERKLITEFTTKDLSEELTRRMGITTFEVASETDVKIEMFSENESHCYRFSNSGPLIIHVNQD